MIITLIFIAMVIIGTVLVIIDQYGCCYDFWIWGWLIRGVGLVFLIISLGLIALTHGTADAYIYKNRIQYEGLCKRYEVIKSEYEDISKSDLIADITEWNAEVYSFKYWSKNPWTNWFNPQKIADNLKYIPLE